MSSRDARTDSLLPAGSRSSGSAQIQMRVLEDPQLVAPIWQRLWDLYGDHGLTTSWEWIECWLRHYADQVETRFVIGHVNGIPVGVVLVSRGFEARRGPVRLRTVHFGTAGEPSRESICVEYNRLLVAPRERQSFVAALVRMLPRIAAHDEFRLDGMAPEDADVVEAVTDGLVLDRRLTYVTDLENTAAAGQSIEEALRRHTASKYRRTRKRIETEYGPVTTVIAQTTAEGLEVMSELRRLHQARWEADGHPGVFASPRFSGFHEDLVRRLLPQGRILLARVTAGEQTVGCDYGFIERNRVLSYQWGLAQFEDKRLSPGLLVGVSVMQAALEAGLSEYDWLAGDVLYKRELSTGQRTIVWARRPNGWRMRMIESIASGAKRLEATWGNREQKGTPIEDEEDAA